MRAKRKALTPEQKAARKARRIEREMAAPKRESEAAIQARVVEALEALGCLVERRGEGGGKGGMRGGSFKTGEPDLRVSYRGLTFGIEVKRDATEPLRDDQIAWYRANSRNVPYFVAASERDGVLAFKTATEGQAKSERIAYDMRNLRDLP